MNRIKFSVLLSLYYKENPLFLQESLDSIFRQTLPPDEVVLMEDGPLTQELYQVVNTFSSSHPEMKVIALKENGGLGKALNEGLKHCSHELVARMDTDDICKPERFAKQVAFLEKHPDIDVVGAWIDEFQKDVFHIVSTRKLPETSEEILLFGKKRNPMNHPVVMFRKKAVEAAGGYKSFYLFEDYYLWVRMLLSGARFYNIQESLLLFRCSPEMFKRRGGLRYACVETRFQWRLYRLGYLTLARTCLNICIRFSARILSNELRGWVYKKMLRKQ